MNDPEVTVLMPAFNAGRFIGASIRSVLRLDRRHAGGRRECR